MDHPFDEFSKSLSESVPRRDLLRRLGAIVAGAALGPLALGVGSTLGNPDERARRRRDRKSLAQSEQACLANKQDACAAFSKRLRTKQQQNQCLSACRTCNNNPNRLSDFGNPPSDCDPDGPYVCP